MCDVSIENMLRTFPECRVTRDFVYDCAMCDTSLRNIASIIFLSDVSHRIVSCVARHSGMLFRSFFECRVTHDCAMCDTTLKDIAYFLSDVSHRIVSCVARHSRNAGSMPLE
jgi:hypothetical protein